MCDLDHIMRFLSEDNDLQKCILIVLNEIDVSITQSELTKWLEIQPASVSEGIAKLENIKYVKRTPSETDRRTVNIELTES